MCNAIRLTRSSTIKFVVVSLSLIKHVTLFHTFSDPLPSTPPLCLYKCPYPVYTNRFGRQNFCFDIYWDV